MSQLPSAGQGRSPSLDTVVGRFNQLWQNGARLALDDYLTDLNADCRLPALAELVHVELEFRLKAGEPARLEEYLERYPELDSPDVLHSLIIAEYRLRQRREPGLVAGEYLERFPRHAEELGKRLGATIPTGIGMPTAVANGRRSAGPLPEWFGRYHILQQLGKGGMGTVYLAHDSQLDRAVAVKIPHFRPEDGLHARERFVIEARAAAALDHRNICPVHDAGQINGIHYLTMAYIEGRPLSDLLRAEQPFTPAEAAALVRKLALALHEAHTQGVIHRDLKPSNILIDKHHEPVLMDFGLARRMGAAGTRLTDSGVVMGTPAYMSPEQANGEVQALGPATDIYSLGVILYEMLAGRPPFTGPAATVLGQIMSATPQPPSAYRPDLDPALEAVCLKAMAKNIADRYPSMSALADALTVYLRHNQIQLSDVMPTRSSGRETRLADADRPAVPALSFWRRRPTYVAAAVSLLFAALGLAAWMVIKINTAKGWLIIESDDPNIEVVVKQGGATIIDRTAQREIVLKPGEYKIELAEAKEGLRLSTKRFTIERGGRQVVRAYLEKPKPESLPPPKKTIETEIAELEQKLRERPGKFEWAIHNQLRHLYGVHGDLRKALYHCDVILHHVPMDGYLLQMLERAFKATDAKKQEAIRNLLTWPEKFPDFLFLKAACWLKVAELLADDKEKSANLLRKVAALKGEGLDHYRALAAAKLKAASVRPPKEADDPQHRAAAKLALEQGAVVQVVLEDGRQIEIKRPEDLPAKAFRTRSVWFEDHTGRIDDTLVERLGGLAANVETLALVNCRPVTDAGLAHLCKWSKLRYLKLNSTSISDAGLVHLAAMPSLKVLYLDNTAIGDAGLAHLRKLKLEELVLQDTRVTDEGLKHLAAMRTLVMLDLNHDEVTDAGLNHLRGLTALQELKLRGTKATEEGVRRLKTALPGCRIFFAP